MFDKPQCTSDSKTIKTRIRDSRQGGVGTRTRARRLKGEGGQGGSFHEM